MSREKIARVKSDRGFRIFDLIVYGVIAALAASLFIAVFFTRNNNPLSGVIIYLQNNEIYEYDFEKGESRIYAADGVTESASEEGKVIVSVHTGSGYNVIEINARERKVRVTDSDCGKKDCVYTAAISDGGGIIYCSPHKLKIEPYDFEYDGGNIII